MIQGENAPSEQSSDSKDTGHAHGWLTRNLGILSLVSFLEDTASELLYPILPIFVTVVLRAPAAVLGSMEGLGEGLKALILPLAGWAGDRRRRKPLIAAGYGLSALSKLLIALGEDLAHRLRRQMCRRIRSRPARGAARRAYR